MFSSNCSGLELLLLLSGTVTPILFLANLRSSVLRNASYLVLGQTLRNSPKRLLPGVIQAVAQPDHKVKRGDSFSAGRNWNENISASLM